MKPTRRRGTVGLERRRPRPRRFLRGVRLRAHVFDHRPALIERSLLLAVFGLSLASAGSLALLWRHARRRLHAEAERDRLFRLSGDLMCVLDERGRFERVNPAFLALFGEKAENRTLPSLTHPDDRPAVASALQRACRRDSPGADFEARFEHLDSWRWLQWSLRGDPEGEIRSLYGVAHDVTERKSVENALAAETSFRRAMEDSMLTGMRAFDSKGRILSVNRAFCEMTGYTSEELVGCAPPYPYWPERAMAQSRQGPERRGTGGRLRGSDPPPRRRVLRCPHVCFTAGRARRTADRLDEFDHRHHRAETDPRRARGRPRTVHHRPR